MSCPRPRWQRCCHNSTTHGSSRVPAGGLSAPRALLHRDALPNCCSRLPVSPGNIVFELLGLDPPLASAADLDGGKFTAADQGIGLRGGYVQHLGDICQRQESLIAHGTHLSHRITAACTRCIPAAPVWHQQDAAGALSTDSTFRTTTVSFPLRFLHNDPNEARGTLWRGPAAGNGGV